MLVAFSDSSGPAWIVAQVQQLLKTDNFEGNWIAVFRMVLTVPKCLNRQLFYILIYTIYLGFKYISKISYSIHCLFLDKDPLKDYLFPPWDNKI